jgi:hypothetical protein
MAKKAQWDSRDFVTVDTEQIEQKMQDLGMTQPEIKKSLKSAIRQSLNIYRSGVRKGAVSVTSNREKRQKGVGLVVYKNGSGGQVNIYKGDYMKSVKGRGFFTLRWLERGTKDVIGRDGRFHGATPAKPFFENAASLSVNQAESKLSENILQTIEKVASKRK